MLRFFFVITISIPWIILYTCKGKYIERHSDRYTEDDRYALAQKVIACMKRNGFITTNVYGKENLPQTGGYVMYSNHQGKYDALGIMYGHDRPCTIMMDAKRSKLPIVDPFMTLIKGCRLDKAKPKSQVKEMRRVTNELKEGRKYIIFPEGGYYHNRNAVHDFMPGSFKCAMRAKVPIVPVAIVDSYKPFEINSLRKVKTQVHFLPAISYEEYKDMSTAEVSELVRDRIVERIDMAVHYKRTA